MGAITDEDRAGIEEILEYWFGTTEDRDDPDHIMERIRTLWFADDPKVDEEIRRRFGLIHERAAAGELDHWRATAPGRMALLILLDQFSRNMFRESGKAFAQDHKVRDLAVEGLELGIERQLAPVERFFLYLPLEHSESLEDQVRSVQCFEDLHRTASPREQAYTGTALEYARKHKAVIERFGRFPHRNEALGRPSTQEEAEFVREYGAGF